MVPVSTFLAVFCLSTNAEKVFLLQEEEVVEGAEEGVLLDSRILPSNPLNMKSTMQANGMIEETVLEVAVAVVANPRAHRDRQVVLLAHKRLLPLCRLLHLQSRK